MKRRLAQPIAAVAAILLAVGMCPAGENRHILTGSDNGVWLIRVDQAKGVFDIALRAKDGNWKWHHQTLSGLPDAAVADNNNKLHVVFTSPLQQLVFEPDGRQTSALAARDARWPDSAAPLAMCQWQDANSGQSIGLLAIVPRPAAPTPTTASAPATAPATASRPAPRTAPARPTTAPAARGLRTVDLGVFRRVDANWEHLTDLPGVVIGDSAAIGAACDRGRVYLMISDPGRGPNQLHEWSDGQWQSITLAGTLAEDAPLAMVKIAKRLMVVLAGPADSEGQRQFILAERTADDANFKTHVMLHGQEPATWPLGPLPEVSRIGDQLALLWQDANGPAFGKCEPRQGQFIPEGPVDVFDQAPDGNAAEELITKFALVIMVAIVALTVVLRPKNATQELFVLPPTVRPGSLIKRMLAFLLDWNLCLLIIFMLYSITLNEQQQADLIERVMETFRPGNQQNLPIEFAVMQVVTLLVHAAYSTIMEIRTGATLGKMLFKLRVVGPKAQPVNLRHCAIRGLTRIIETIAMMWYVLMPLVPMVMILTRYNQRIGDLLARTTVVDAVSLAQYKPEGSAADPNNPDESESDSPSQPSPPDQRSPEDRGDKNAPPRP